MFDRENEQFEGIAESFSEDMRQAFSPGQPVPAELDRSILDSARDHFQQQFPPNKKSPFRRTTWRWAAALTSAAAVLFLVFVYNGDHLSPTTQPPLTPRLEVAEKSGKRLSNAPAQPKDEIYYLSPSPERPDGLPTEITIATYDGSTERKRTEAGTGSAGMGGGALGVDEQGTNFAQLVAGDIDRNGKVDILDAFQLARLLETNGRVNQTLDKQWDMNGDGLIDRKDVDAVAFAAVRLSQGVL